MSKNPAPEKLPLTPGQKRMSTGIKNAMKDLAARGWKETAPKRSAPKAKRAKSR